MSTFLLHIWGSGVKITYTSNTAVGLISEEALAVQVGVYSAGGGQDGGENRDANHFVNVTY